MGRNVLDVTWISRYEVFFHHVINHNEMSLEA